MTSELEVLSRSKEESDRRRAIPLLEAHVAQRPTDIGAWYRLACCHDFIGEEVEAEPRYRRVYELGWKQLPAKDQSGFFVGFGSTLRNNGKFEDSARFLEEAIAAFPEYPALQVFLAFTRYSQGRERAAAAGLFRASAQIAKHGLDGYERAIQYYAENL